MNNYSKVYKELDEIFKYLPQEILEKIPEELIKNIKNNMDNDYEYKVTHVEDFSNQEMMKETRAMLAVLYRDYWASKEEREEILEEERKEILKIEQEKKEKNVEKYNIFEEPKKMEETVSKAVVVYKEGFLNKIINKIINKIMSWFKFK